MIVYESLKGIILVEQSLSLMIEESTRYSASFTVISQIQNLLQAMRENNLGIKNILRLTQEKILKEVSRPSSTEVLNTHFSVYGSADLS